jgi:uncharacterized RDD family membrane protein YckC
MRCPKCHYISFDTGDRCRNCGYDFSLSVETVSPDLPITSSTPDGPLADFALEVNRPVPARAPDTASDLPLFSRSTLERAAVPPPPAPPRPPLAVRRSTPPRERSRIPDTAALELEFAASSARRRARSMLSDAAEPNGESTNAKLLSRIAAGFIDAVLIASIDVAVIYLTLRVCGLTRAELRELPPVPLAAFLLLLAGGYLISFTVASGQTIGKMVLGIRVVPIPERDPGNARVTFGSAVLRAVACLVSLLTAGLGYIPILFSQDRRALHDRLADTRVVRA